MTLGQSLHTRLFENFVVPFTCPVLCSQGDIKAHVRCEWAEQNPSIICVEFGLSPPRLANKPKAAGHNNENSVPLVYQSLQLSPTSSQKPLLPIASQTNYLVCNLYQRVTRSI